jgi:hypothetical protein
VATNNDVRRAQMVENVWILDVQMMVNVHLRNIVMIWVNVKRTYAYRINEDVKEVVSLNVKNEV